MKFQVEQHDGTTRVTVSGEITEESDFGPIIDEIEGAVVVDLGGVTRINSCGVREWLNFVTALKGASRSLTLDRCPPVIVTHLNTIYNFTGGGTVRSVFGPYYCADCDKEERHLIDLTGGHPSPPPAIKCPECGSSMEFEEIHEEYLSFHGGRS
jgi:anti-anti-sigma regulatory factor/DNA-directed RNA polymerase subunit RPC12/RpoP